MWVMTKSDWPVLVNLSRTAHVGYQQIAKFDPAHPDRGLGLGAGVHARGMRRRRPGKGPDQPHFAGAGETGKTSSICVVSIWHSWR